MTILDEERSKTATLARLVVRMGEALESHRATLKPHYFPYLRPLYPWTIIGQREYDEALNNAKGPDVKRKDCVLPLIHPFTDATRQAYREWAEVPHPIQEERDQAIAYLRYEATLKAKDAQIEALVKLLESAQATTQFRDQYEEFGAAIKEATNGS